MTSGYTLFPVDDERTSLEFLQFPIHLYHNDPNWIRPLDDDINKVFDPAYNKFFRHGELIRWVLRDEHAKTVGRVAAFIDHKTAGNNEQPTGGMGFSNV